jgi:hypothetical protein
MKKAMMTAVIASSLSLGACATTGQDGYYNDGRSSTAGRAATGAAVIGAVVNGRQYYRDTRGYCYYVDRNGQPVYDNTTRC